ncbi:hypothetical protein O6H91_10G109400 [Diphasiastrum complanatum]|uniref:Uncharacterized protein n=1 Tax=Diphasiastrum complanatum TaxID=34168 RepID=A0ACC2CKK9_DIPCM|nr:hypothetical protein O6H91_10G109400 [Diphasiastrum complanatum]
MDNSPGSTSSPVARIEAKPSTPFSAAGKLHRGGNSIASKRKGERKALADRTNDSPIFGLVPGYAIPSARRSPYFHDSNFSSLKSSISSSEDPSIGEDLLRSQVKSLLQKVDHEGSRFPVLRTLSQLNGFLSSPGRKASSACDPVGLPATPTLLFGKKSRLANTISRFQGCSVSEVESQQVHVYVDLGLHSPDESLASDVESKAELVSDCIRSNEARKSESKTPIVLSHDDETSNTAKGITRILHFDSPEKPSADNSACRSSFDVHESGSKFEQSNPFQLNINSKSGCSMCSSTKGELSVEQIDELVMARKQHVSSSSGNRIMFYNCQQFVENRHGSTVDLDCQEIYETVDDDCNTNVAQHQCKDLSRIPGHEDIQSTLIIKNRDQGTENTQKCFQAELHQENGTCNHDMPTSTTKTRKKTSSSRLRA